MAVTLSSLFCLWDSIAHRRGGKNACELSHTYLPATLWCSCGLTYEEREGEPQTQATGCRSGAGQASAAEPLPIQRYFFGEASFWGTSTLSLTSGPIQNTSPGLSSSGAGGRAAA